MDIVPTQEITHLEELLTIKKNKLHKLIDEVDELERTIRSSSAEHFLKFVEEANQTEKEVIMNAKENPLCVYPGCLEPHSGTRAPWCNKHWGYYPHQCEAYGCERTVQYDDEPMCFTHSPDEGSSVRGYSAWKKAKAVE